MIAEKIKGYYGEILQPVEEYVRSSTAYLTDEQKASVFQWLAENHPRKKGTPDIATIKKAIVSCTGSTPRTYVWKVCECGCEYDYRLQYCPLCVAKALQNQERKEAFKTVMREQSYRVKKADVRPEHIVRYNKQYIGDGSEIVCYCCVHKQAYCKHYGQTEWECHEYRDCPCASCCMAERKLTEKLLDKKIKV